MNKSNTQTLNLLNRWHDAHLYGTRIIFRILDTLHTWFYYFYVTVVVHSGCIIFYCFFITSKTLNQRVYMYYLCGDAGYCRNIYNTDIIILQVCTILSSPLETLFQIVFLHSLKTICFAPLAITLTNVMVSRFIGLKPSC